VYTNTDTYQDKSLKDSQIARFSPMIQKGGAPFITWTSWSSSSLYRCLRTPLIWSTSLSMPAHYKSVELYECVDRCSLTGGRCSVVLQPAAPLSLQAARSACTESPSCARSCLVPSRSSGLCSSSRVICTLRNTCVRHSAQDDRKDIERSQLSMNDSGIPKQVAAFQRAADARRCH
jgi:hypothetical protein